MSLRSRRLFALSVLALVTGACDQPNPAAPGELQRQAWLATYSVVASTDTAASPAVTATIGTEGGSIIAGNHVLTVLPGSVSAPTAFTMKSYAGTVQIDLSARSVATGLPVSVFPQPLRLSLSYGKAKIGNPNRLMIAWILNGQIVTVQPSDVDKSTQLVTTWLYHFSDYGLVTD